MKPPEVDWQQLDTIIDEHKFVVDKHHLPTAVAGFNSESLLAAFYSVIRQHIEGKVFLESINEPMYWITDLRAVAITMNSIMEGSSQGARGEEPFWHHPLIIEMLFISDNKVIKVAAKGLNTVSFGNLSVKVFDTLEDALAYCRSHMRSIT